MTIVDYQCDTCKRTVEIIRNIRGLDTLQRCTITLGCRGRLYQIGLHQDFTRAAIPDDVNGLDNWQQRHVLFNHEQAIKSNIWTIKHNLGTFPSISIFVDKPTSDDLLNQEEIIAQDVEIVSPDITILHFDRAYSGIAQLVARSSDPQLLQPITITDSQLTDDPVQISNGSRIAFATQLSKFGTGSKFNIVLEFTNSTGAKFLFSYSSSLTLNGTGWSDTNRIIFKGKVYIVREFIPLINEMITGLIDNGTTFRVRSVDTNANSFVDYVIDQSDRLWASNSVYLANDMIVNGSNLYLCQLGGTSSNVGTGPSGTGNTIIDGTVVWNFHATMPSTDFPEVLNSGDVLMLLTSAPYGSVDKITNRCIDVITTTKIKNPHGMFYSDFEFFASNAVIQTIYPAIRTV